MTSTVLQNMLVLSAGTTIQPDARGQAIQAPTVTLLATPEQSETLTLAGNEGRLQLVLRKFERSERREDRGPLHQRTLWRPAQGSGRARGAARAVAPRPVVIAAALATARPPDALGPDRRDQRYAEDRRDHAQPGGELKEGNEYESQSHLPTPAATIQECRSAPPWPC